MPEPLAPGVWEPAQGSLYSLQGNHSVLRLADRLGIPNGLDWSTDQRTFYHVDSLDYAVHAYDYDMQAGTIGEHPAPHAGLGDRLLRDSDARDRCEGQRHLDTEEPGRDTADSQTDRGLMNRVGWRTPPPGLGNWVEWEHTASAGAGLSMCLGAGCPCFVYTFPGAGCPGAQLFVCLGVCVPRGSS